jgi:neutral ceramidase
MKSIRYSLVALLTALITCNLGVVSNSTLEAANRRPAQPAGGLRAGFARVKITPPIGTAMTGYGARDWDPAGCKGIHDDVYVRSLYLSQGVNEFLIMGFDLLFFSREEADRFKGAIGRKLDLPPSHILLNTSHTHTGPKVGTWYYTPSDPFYLSRVESAIMESALQARKSARSAKILAGSGTTALPLSRRYKDERGIIQFQPNASGTVFNGLPVIVIQDMAGNPICLVFSVACHPSIIKGDVRSYQISADYPGAAMQKLDAFLGTTASLFLQGAGGDAKASVIGKGEKEWRAGDWDDVDKAGAMVAEEVKSILQKGLTETRPDIKAALLVMNWPLAPAGRMDYEEILKNPKTGDQSSPEILKLWAKEQLAALDRGYELPTSVEITLHGIRLGNGLRLVGIEGEAVAELGLLIDKSYPQGTTFALGYTDGAQMYLPTSKMLDEGGYEVVSFWEYRKPSRLAKGMERILMDSLAQLRSLGIE